MKECDKFVHTKHIYTIRKPVPRKVLMQALVSGLRIRIRINLSCWIRIRIQIADPNPGGQKPQKIEKSEEFSCFEVLDVLF
jgi:hypothetical protein